MILIAVIGFSTENLELQEGVEEQQKVHVKLLTSADALDESVRNYVVNVTLYPVMGALLS